MSRVLLIATFVLLTCLPACQCDQAPPVGPTERQTSTVFDLAGRA